MFDNMKLRVALICAFLCSGSNTALAAAFYIQEQSVSGLGTAFAGAVADTPDASTVYYNPAGMTRLDPRPQISVGTHVIIPSADTDNLGSTVNSGAATGNTFVTLQGDDG